MNFDVKRFEKYFFFYRMSHISREYCSISFMFYAKGCYDLQEPVRGYIFASQKQP